MFFVLSEAAIAVNVGVLIWALEWVNNSACGRGSVDIFCGILMSEIF